MNTKTTIAINWESREKLEKIKEDLETETARFVDMDEVIKVLLDCYFKLKDLQS